MALVATGTGVVVHAVLLHLEELASDAGEVLVDAGAEFRPGDLLSRGGDGHGVNSRAYPLALLVAGGPLALLRGGGVVVLVPAPHCSRSTVLLVGIIVLPRPVRPGVAVPTEVPSLGNL